MLEAARVWAGTFEEGNIRFPLYDGDLEQDTGIPADVDKLAEQIGSADAVLIVFPEYNKSYPGVLKNALDWVSRVKGAHWKGKPVALMSATAGREGGARAQFALRLTLNYGQPRVLAGPEVLVANAGNEFDSDGRLCSESYQNAVEALIKALWDEAERV